MLRRGGEGGLQTVSGFLASFWEGCNGHEENLAVAYRFGYPLFGILKTIFLAYFCNVDVRNTVCKTFQFPKHK